MKKVLFILFTALINLTCVINSDPATEYTYAPEVWGEWLRIDNGALSYITGSSISGFSSKAKVSRVSARVISVKESGRVYYLCASRIANASFSGNIAKFASNTNTSNMGNTKVTITNTNESRNKTSVKTNSSGKFTVKGIIVGDTYTVSAGGEAANIVPKTNGDDIGTITVGSKFKATIKSNTDMQQLYANTNYSFTIDIRGLDYVPAGVSEEVICEYGLELDRGLSFANGDLTGTIGSTGTKSIPLTLRCGALSSDFEHKKINITVSETRTKTTIIDEEPITEQTGKRTWKDSVSLKFNKASLEINIRANKSISGVIVVPGANAQHFSGTSSSITVPHYSGTYLVAVSGSADTTYALGINTSADSNFSGLVDTNIYEPNDSEGTASVLGLNSRITAYLHEGDIDYYEIK